MGPIVSSSRSLPSTSRSRVRGLPYVVSETNCPFPNDFAAGFTPILAAYACFQDWDGIFMYTYNDNEPEDTHGGVVRGFFSIGNDPLKMAELAARARQRAMKYATWASLWP